MSGNRRNPLLAESISHLKDALKSLAAHQGDHALDGNDGGCGYIMDHIRSHIRDHAGADAMHEVKSYIDTALGEAGAKFSVATRTELTRVRDSLDTLLNPPAPADDEEPVDVAADVEEAVTAIIDTMAAIPAAKTVAEGANTTDAAKVKKPGIEGGTVQEGKTVIPSNLTKLAETATLLGEAAGSTVDAPAFDMLIIKSGMSLNRVNYSESVLERSIPLLESRPIYVDHPTPGEARGLARKVGWWDNIRMQEVDGHRAVVGRANIMENSGQPWFLPMLREALDRGHPEMVGISILAGGDTQIKKDDKGLYKEVLEVKVYASADAVSEPGAGGRPLSLAANAEEDTTLEILNDKTKGLAEIMAALPDLKISEIAAARPELFESDGVTPKLEVKEVIKEVKAPEALTADAATALVEGMNQLRRDNTRMVLDAKLKESHLPKATQDRVRTRVGDGILAESQIDTIIAEFADILGDAQAAGAAAGGIGGWQVPYGNVKVGLTISEQMQLGFDEWFGAPIDPEKKGKFQSIRSMREAYIAVTGDRDFRGQYNPEYSVMAEALPTATLVVGGPAITMSNLLGTSMNKSLVPQYQNQPKWWEPVVQKASLDNMKQQDRLRLISFGSLTQRTVDGAEYTELTWGDNDEHYTPTEYGNLVTIGRRAIINDDLKGIQRLPQLLAQSAVLTLNEFVSALFTANSGAGPAMQDGYDVFDVSHHQGNSVTTALNRSNLIALMKVIMKMQNDASKVIGLMPRFLLTPIDLWDTGYELIQTQFVPDSANNAKNVIADEANGGLRRNITVPNWTDTNNWYLMADPAQIACLELGFLFGREEPELLSQQDPTSGMVWTNDVISYKVRFDVGGAWIDYRGAAAALVS